MFFAFVREVRFHSRCVISVSFDGLLVRHGCVFLLLSAERELLFVVWLCCVVFFFCVCVFVYLCVHVFVCWCFLCAGVCTPTVTAVLHSARAGAQLTNAVGESVEWTTRSLSGASKPHTEACDPTGWAFKVAEFNSVIQTTTCFVPSLSPR